MRLKSLFLSLVVATAVFPAAFAAESTNRSGLVSSTTLVAPATTNATTKKSPSSKPASEDAVIKNLHSLGLINGQTNIYRCANPVMDVAEQMKSASPDAEELKQAKEHMQRLSNLGIRTVISFENQNPPKENETNAETIAVALEQTAAKEVGLAYVAYPMSNSGKNSFKDMTDEAVMKLLAPISEDIFNFAKTGGVVFHCKGGRDRTGIMAGYLRMKYQHWTADEAIAEMRSYGHLWNRFAKAGATNSWHEEHLRAIGIMLNSSSTQ